MAAEAKFEIGDIVFFQGRTGEVLCGEVRDLESRWNKNGRSFMYDIQGSRWWLAEDKLFVNAEEAAEDLSEDAIRMKACVKVAEEIHMKIEFGIATRYERHSSIESDIVKLAIELFHGERR